MNSTVASHSRVGWQVWNETTVIAEVRQIFVPCERLVCTCSYYASLTAHLHTLSTVYIAQMSSQMLSAMSLNEAVSYQIERKCLCENNCPGPEL